MRPRYATVLETAAILALATGCGALGWRLWTSGFSWGVAGGLLAGYVLADVASGLTHWFCDTFFEETTPVIGPLLIQPFREHHRDPRGMTRHGFLELTGNSALGLLPVVGLSLLWPIPAWASAAVLTFALALFATNLFHKWAHAESVPRAIAWLQACRLILHPAHHAAHHQPPHQKAFGVTNGWANILLNRVLR